jgi:hypothetical protein
MVHALFIVHPEGIPVVPRHWHAVNIGPRISVSVRSRSASTEAAPIPQHANSSADRRRRVILWSQNFDATSSHSSTTAPTLSAARVAVVECRHHPNGCYIRSPRADPALSTQISSAFPRRSSGSAIYPLPRRRCRRHRPRGTFGNDAPALPTGTPPSASGTAAGNTRAPPMSSTRDQIHHASTVAPLRQPASPVITALSWVRAQPELLAQTIRPPSPTSRV